MRKIIQKPVRDLMRQIAKDYNLPYTTVEDIIFSQFEFVKNSIGEGVKGDYNSFKDVLLRRLGTFKASEKKINYMTDRYLKEEDNA